VQAHVALQQVQGLGDPRPGVAERRAESPPADPAIVAAIGRAGGEHRHRPTAQSELQTQRVLRLAAGPALADLLDLGGGQLRSLL